MSKPGKYSPMSKSLSRDDPNAESLMNVEEDDTIFVNQIKNPKDLWKWFIKDPCSRWQVVFFLGIFVLSIVLVVISAVDPSSSYVTAGVAGVVVAGYGFFHFRTLMALREEVDQMERHNNDFKQQNAALLSELAKLEHTKEELTQTSTALEDTTKKNKENLEKFEKIQRNLEIMGSKNISGMTQIAEQSRSIADHWKKELHKQERELFFSVFEQLEMKDDNEEMTKKEYDEFLDELPPKYRMKLQHEGTFDKMAGDDGLLNYKEFSQVLDHMAKQFSRTTANVIPSSSNSSSAIAAGNGAAGGVIEED